MTDILICSRDSASAQFLETMLGEEGFGADSISSVSEAAAMCLKRTYKMAIVPLDEDGPEESGLEAVKLLRRLDPHLPVVVVSDESGLERERQLREMGIFYLLTRPLSSAELRDVCRCAINKHNREEA